MNASLRLTLTLLVLGAACRKAEEAPVPVPGSVAAALAIPSAVPAASETLAARSPGIAEEERDRRLMVRPAPMGFKPKSEGLTLEVRLVPEESRIRIGTPLRIRLEVQNVGTQMWRYMGEHSLLKSRGSTDNDWEHWKFFATGPDGSRFQLNGALPGSSLVDAEVMEPAAAQRLVERARAFRYLRVDLAPGETILSVRRAGDVADDWVPKETDRYVEVANRHEFESVGVYEIETEHTARRYDPETRNFAPEATFRSSPIRIEVLP